MSIYTKMINALDQARPDCNKLRNLLQERDRWKRVFNATLNTRLFPIAALLKSHGFPAPEFRSECDDHRALLEYVYCKDGEGCKWVAIAAEPALALFTYPVSGEEHCTYVDLPVLLQEMQALRPYML